MYDHILNREPTLNLHVARAVKVIHDLCDPMKGSKLSTIKALRAVYDLDLRAARDLCEIVLEERSIADSVFSE